MHVIDNILYYIHSKKCKTVRKKWQPRLLAAATFEVSTGYFKKNNNR